MKWISVKEKLPEVSMKPILIYGHRINGRKMPVKIAYWNEVWLNWLSNTVIQRNVTHWMPLPKPPGEECEHKEVISVRHAYKCKDCGTLIEQL